MPSDIRSFFGGKPAASQEKPVPAKAKPVCCILLYFDIDVGDSNPS